MLSFYMGIYLWISNIDFIIQPIWPFQLSDLSMNQDGGVVTDGIFRCIVSNENISISYQVNLMNVVGL